SFLPLQGPHGPENSISPRWRADACRQDVLPVRPRDVYRSIRSILAPSSETPAISPALVNAKETTGSFTVLVSSLPLAPTFATATVASTPAVQPELLRKSFKASGVMNRITMARDWAPA